MTDPYMSKEEHEYWEGMVEEKERLEQGEFREGDFVRYVPMHAQGDINHPDCEDGVVTSVRPNTVFVRFGRQQYSKGCDRSDLVSR